MGGVHPETLFLAGTFAEHMNLNAAKNLGLLPSSENIVTLGNASLKGTFVYANMSADQKIPWAQTINPQKRLVELALREDFQDRFVRHLELSPS